MGPYTLLEFTPDNNKKQHSLHTVNRGGATSNHLFLWLWDRAPRMELDLLLGTWRFPKTSSMTITLLSRVHLARAGKSIGEYGILSSMPPAVHCRYSRSRPLCVIETLIEEHELVSDPRVTRRRSSDDETAADTANFAATAGRVNIFADTRC